MNRPIFSVSAHWNWAWKLRKGGTSGAVLNGANEAAVAAFLGGRLGFHQIVPVCRDILRNHNFDPNPTLADVLAMDRWARKEVLRWIAV